ncbi:MAG TPA: hypothetical protein VL326_19185 [Kofleriaceae bacterium]|nr:hypothetical protein [Kofleriaceae bacterium]
MRALLLGVVAVLAACDEPPGLTLEVVPQSPNVEYVEVYLADHCAGCPDAMTPPMMQAHVANMYQTSYPRVFSASKSEPDKWKDGHAFFRVTSQTGMDDYVTYMLLIGFDANKTPIEINRFSGVTIPGGGGSEYWQVKLDEPVAPLTDTPSDVERIAIWGADTGPRCVIIVNGDRADGIVPWDPNSAAPDPDCDGMTQHECAPFIPNAVHVAPDIEHSSCVTPVPPVMNGTTTSPICLIGGPPCTDGTPTQGCEPLDIDYCAPAKTCGSCAYPNDWETCARVKVTNPDTTLVVPFVNCTFAMNLDGTECSDGNLRRTDMNLDGLLTNGGGTKCTKIQLHTLAMPLGPFVDKLDVAGLTVEVANFQQPCSVEVRWSGNFMRGIGPQTIGLDAALDNGKHMVFPLVFHGTDACTNPSSCKLTIPDPTESMLQCAKPTVDTTTCTVSTPACYQGGVTCGARCCAPGENCRDGACHCGDGPACGDAACVSASPNPAPSDGCGDACCGSIPGLPGCG